MPFPSLLPNLAGASFVVVMFTVIGFMGALALIYSVLLEAERRQDAVIVVASTSLLVYALFIGDRIFAFAMAGMFIVAGRELIQILRGKHRHSSGDIEKYEYPTKK